MESHESIYLTKRVDEQPIVPDSATLTKEEILATRGMSLQWKDEVPKDASKPAETDVWLQKGKRTQKPKNGHKK
jgi:hypothetical protein